VTTFVAKTVRRVTEKRDVEVEHFKVLENVHIHGLKCSACKGDCDVSKPLVFAWAEERGWRLCHKCGAEQIAEGNAEVAA
jgi:hypothetical protein